MVCRPKIKPNLPEDRDGKPRVYFQIAELPWKKVVRLFYWGQLPREITAKATTCYV